MNQKIIINVKHEINSASALTREQGKIIYDTIVKNINLENYIELDFKDVESIITPFLNVAIGKLYESYSSEELNKFLTIINIPTGKAASFNIVINNAKRYYADNSSFEKTIKDTIDI